MRLILDLIIAAAIIALGWEKPLKERISELPWLGDKTAPTESHPRPSSLNPHPVPTASPSGAWMWDPKRQSILDTPKPKTATTPPVPSSTAGSSLLGPNHRSPLDPPGTKPQQPTPR
jgi:hypothetical protein